MKVFVLVRKSLDDDFLTDSYVRGYNNHSDAQKVMEDEYKEEKEEMLEDCHCPEEELAYDTLDKDKAVLAIDDYSISYFWRIYEVEV